MSIQSPYKAFVFRNRPQDFISSLDVAACYIECRGKYLFLKRSLKCPQGRTWGIPAGKFELGESALDAVLREVFEEVGLSLLENSLDDLGKVFVRYPHQDFTYYMFHQELADFPQIILSDEHEEYRWLSLEEAEEIPLISGAKEAFEHMKALFKKSSLPRKDFYFIRHGETDANLSLDVKVADANLALNAKGRLQTERAAELMRKIAIKDVYTSSLQRAVETTDILVKNRALSPIELDSLGECTVGIWKNMIAMEKGRDFELSTSVEDFIAEKLETINFCLQGTDPTLIVAHGGLHWVLCYYMGIENHPWKIGNAQLVHFTPKGSREWTASIYS